MLKAFIKSVLASTALLLSVQASQAAITLRIDSSAKTFQWIGSYSTNPYSLDPGDDRSVILGTSAYVGGNSTGTGFLNVTQTEPWVDWSENDAGQLLVVPSSLHSYLGDARNREDEEGGSSLSFALNIVGDGTLYSYAEGYDAELESYLLSFNGANLYLWIGGDPGLLAGSVEVIPEPSLALLLLPGMGLLWAARSRNRASVS